MKLDSLRKRSWNPYVYKSDGKWYTGYAGAWYMHDKISNEPAEHKVRSLTLTPSRTTRGRSAANMVFKDQSGFEYIMSLDGGFKLIKKMLKGEIKVDGEYLTVDFVQVKKGSNIFIEAVEDD